MEDSAIIRLLICGTPGTGKSSFCRWLAAEHGFEFLEFDATGALPDDRDISAARVAFEWGFVPLYIDSVKEFIDEGGWQHWWFDGDRVAAHASYTRRQLQARADPTGSERAWDTQMSSITARWDDIAALFEGRIINTLDETSVFLANEVILRRLLPGGLHE